MTKEFETRNRELHTAAEDEHDSGSTAVTRAAIANNDYAADVESHARLVRKVRDGDSEQSAHLATVNRMAREIESGIETLARKEKEKEDKAHNRREPHTPRPGRNF
ncbi:hypothetical protein N7488_012267 [Penicillium malachiteum]|nr:hypothetical protein N7488_012267 [Penicillium malachiteum]